jgi:hypothetical protein
MSISSAFPPSTSLIDLVVDVYDCEHGLFLHADTDFILRRGEDGVLAVSAKRWHAGYKMLSLTETDRQHARDMGLVICEE